MSEHHQQEMPLSAMMRAAMGAPPDRLSQMWQLGEALVSGQIAYEAIEDTLHEDAELEAVMEPLHDLAHEIEGMSARTDAEIRVKLAAFIWCRVGEMIDRDDMTTLIPSAISRGIERRDWTLDTRLAVGIAQDLLGIPREPNRLPRIIDGRIAA